MNKVTLTGLFFIVLGTVLFLLSCAQAAAFQKNIGFWGSFTIIIAGMIEMFVLIAAGYVILFFEKD